MNNETKNKRDALVDRVRKLYAMGQQAEASPNEAAIAMKRCMFLMESEGITLADLETSEFGVSKTEKEFKSVPSYIRWIHGSVGRLHDCIAVSGGGSGLEFRGFELDANVAKLTFDYIIEAMERSVKVAKKNGDIEPGRYGARDFRIGFAESIRARIIAIVEDRQEQQRANAQTRQSTAEQSTGTTLAVQKLRIVKQKMSDDLGKPRKAKRVTYRSRDCLEAGNRAGENVSLNTQVNSGNSAPMIS